jgi:hypothetical protein
MSEGVQRQPVKAELAALGITIVSQHPLTLYCKHCRMAWTPQPHADESLPQTYWHCPKKCNVPLLSTRR